MEFCGKKQREVAGALGVSPQTFNTWCKGIAVPRMEKLTHLADYFGVEKGELLKANRTDRFTITMADASMEPRICEGDLVVVHKQEEVASGDLVVVLMNRDQMLCRRQKKYAEGMILYSSNPQYDPMFISDQELKQQSARILGKAVEVRGKL